MNYEYLKKKKWSIYKKNSSCYHYQQSSAISLYLPCISSRWNDEFHRRGTNHFSNQWTGALIAFPEQLWNTRRTEGERSTPGRKVAALCALEIRIEIPRPPPSSNTIPITEVSRKLSVILVTRALLSGNNTSRVLATSASALSLLIQLHRLAVVLFAMANWCTPRLWRKQIVTADRWLPFVTTRSH